MLTTRRNDRARQSHNAKIDVNGDGLVYQIGERTYRCHVPLARRIPLPLINLVRNTRLVIPVCYGKIDASKVPHALVQRRVSLSYLIEKFVAGDAAINEAAEVRRALHLSHDQPREVEPV